MIITNENSGKKYEILKQAGHNYLLRDISTGMYVIAHGFRDAKSGWDQGKYFGYDDEAKAQAEETFSQYETPDAYGYH